jgi:hypothetical protein
VSGPARNGKYQVSGLGGQIRGTQLMLDLGHKEERHVDINPGETLWLFKDENQDL